MSSDAGKRRKVALVTGSVGGLGRACCEALAETGAHVVVTDIDDAGAQAAAEHLRGHGASASAIAFDVRDSGAVDAAVAEAAERHGGLDILVNLAGALRNQVVTKILDEDFEFVLATHLKGTLHSMRAAIPLMRANGYGRIVNTSSVAARGSIAGGSYGAAKGGIEGLTRSAAMEVARHGITVNCIAPGLVNAGMFLTTDPEYQDQVKAGIPMKRLGEPEEIASCVSFLTSTHASYVTGQTLTICGGLSLGF
jgi:3-oxoacyl-[acyl-carrier protein] reductase